MVCCLVHSHLKDILGHLQPEWHMQEPVPTTMCVKHGEILRFLFQVDAPVAILTM